MLKFVFIAKFFDFIGTLRSSTRSQRQLVSIKTVVPNVFDRLGGTLGLRQLVKLSTLNDFCEVKTQRTNERYVQRKLYKKTM